MNATDPYKPYYPRNPLTRTSHSESMFTHKMKAKSMDRPRIVALETRQAELEKRIADLELAATRQLPAPWTQPVYTYPSAPPLLLPIDNSDNARCHICQNRFKDMTHYVCSHPRCPSHVTHALFGDTIHPSFTCGGSSAAGPHGAPRTIGTISQTNPTT